MKTENFEQESKGSNSTDRVTDTFKSILDSIEEEFEQLGGLTLDRKMFLRNIFKFISPQNFLLMFLIYELKGPQIISKQCDFCVFFFNGQC